MIVLKATNAAVAFMLEIALLASFVVWALALDLPWAARIPLAVLAPLAVALFWGLLLAPNAGRRLPMPWIVVVKALLYGLAALALARAGHEPWGIGLIVVALVSLGLAVAWRQEEIVTQE